MKSSDLYKVAKELMHGGVSSPVRAFEPNPIYIKESSGSKPRRKDSKVAKCRVLYDDCLTFIKFHSLSKDKYSVLPASS